MEGRIERRLGSLAMERQELEDALPAFSKPQTWRPPQPFLLCAASQIDGKSSNTSQNSSSMDASSKRLMLHKGTSLLEASLAFASNVRNSVVSRGWRELERVSAVSVAAIPGKAAVNRALSAFDFVAAEVKQACGAGAVAAHDVKRRLVEAVSVYFQNQKRNSVKVVDDRLSERAALTNGYGSSAKTVISPSAGLMQTEKPFPSTPSISTTHQNGRVAIHLRSRL